MQKQHNASKLGTSLLNQNVLYCLGIIFKLDECKQAMSKGS